MINYKVLGTASLFVASALGSAVSQNAHPATTQESSPTAATSSDATSQGNATQGNASTSTGTSATNGSSSAGTGSATGKPLEMQSKEGFFGHLNPLARKKWVHRQIDPVADRANELDQLQAKNANDIRDVDGRATAGISKAMSAASEADGHATDAASRADKANALATTADGKTTSLNGTVSNLDQYQQVSSTALPFLKGRTALTKKDKGSLDDVATSLAAEKGYIVEVQGYSRAGVASSQAMADAVVRYLVTAHQVPIYRIYRTGLGKQKQVASNDTDKPITNGVRVTILHNSLATMGNQSSNNPNSTKTPVSGSAIPAPASE